MKKRENCFDTLKYICILLVMNSHFFLFFYRPLKDFWKEFPYKLFLYGLDGKLGVSIFAVITGYFSFISGKKKGSFIRYALKRYSFFLICSLIINTLLYIMNTEGVRTENSFGIVIGQSVLLDRLIFGTFWFIRPFFVGSLLCFLCGKYDINSLIIIVLMPLMVYINSPFFLTYIANCLLGCILYRLLDLNLDIYRNKWIQLLAAVAIYIFVKRDGYNLTYFIQGLIGVVLIMLIRNNEKMYQLSENKFTAYFGKKTMSLLMSHMLCVYLFNFYAPSLRNNPFLLFLIWLILSHLLAIILDIVINYIVKLADLVIDSIFVRFENLKAGQK
ncbi:MAG: acyltransferase family protein [Erysipelotrichaceae bacterium]|nr:acyltransferase family protein [Erysipelotrichaceae bacterium]